MIIPINLTGFPRTLAFILLIQPELLVSSALFIPILIQDVSVLSGYAFLHFLSYTADCLEAASDIDIDEEEIQRVRDAVKENVEQGPYIENKTAKIAFAMYWIYQIYCFTDPDFNKGYFVQTYRIGMWLFVVAFG